MVYIHKRKGRLGDRLISMPDKGGLTPRDSFYNVTAPELTRLDPRSIRFRLTNEFGMFMGERPKYALQGDGFNINKNKRQLYKNPHLKTIRTRAIRNSKTRRLLERLNRGVSLSSSQSTSGSEDINRGMREMGWVQDDRGYWHNPRTDNNFRNNVNLENENIEARDRRPHIINNWRRRIDNDILAGRAEPLDDNNNDDDNLQPWDYWQNDRIVLHNEDNRRDAVNEYNRRRFRPYKIMVNNRQIPFDIYKFEGDNKAVRNHYVLYYNRKKSQIGIKWVGDLKKPFVPGFVPDFNKRNIFYLEIVDPDDIIGFNGYHCNVLDANNAVMSNFTYSVDDYNNKSDKYCDVAIQGDDGLDYHRDNRAAIEREEVFV